ncbi:glycosyltransferase [Paenibacillus sp. sgz302251]|uniref:glycosyltransferase n=1 Tax=Paenibacillus sp. sgz302251 TaxID=3414493 RepID=UPI003C7D3B04
MSYEVSIVIPSYNKCLEIKLLLYSLNNQTFDRSRMEVIVVDDASTDHTSKSLGRYEPPFPFHYLRNETQKGRSFTRNRGLTVASGKVIIFLDAEMLVEQDFVQNHVEHHKARQDLVLTGAMHLKGVYTVYYPNFSSDVHHNLRLLLKQDGKLYKRLGPEIKKSYSNKAAASLLTRNDIKKGVYRKFCFPRPYFPEILHNFGPDLNEYKLPWTSFISCNVSVRRELLEEVGGFDEGFQGWGFEDWELGYRLYRFGVSFRADSSVGCYHQEHPVLYDYLEMFSNYFFYTQKHPNFETCVHAVFLLGMISRLQEHVLVKEYYLLTELKGQSYRPLLDAMCEMLRNTAAWLKDGHYRDQILMKLRGTSSAASLSLARQQRNELRHSGLCPGLIQTFDDLSGWGDEMQ